MEFERKVRQFFRELNWKGITLLVLIVLAFIMLTALISWRIIKFYTNNYLAVVMLAGFIIVILAGLFKLITFFKKKPSSRPEKHLF